MQKHCRDKFRHVIWPLIAKDRYGLGKEGPDGKYVPLVKDGKNNVPLTEKVLDELYVDAGQYIAVRACNGEKSSVLVFDLDDHSKTVPPYLMRLAAADLVVTLSKAGMTCLPALSSSGHGYHIWLVFERARTLSTVHEHGANLIASLNEHLTSYGNQDRLRQDGKSWRWNVFIPQSYRDEHSWPHESGTITVELLPKSSTTTVALPGVWDGRILQYEVTSNRAELEEGYPNWSALNLRKRGPSSMSAQDKDAAFDTVAASFDCTVRDEWIEFGLLLVAAFGQEDQWARNRYHQWSAGYDKYDERDVEQRWRSFKPTKYTDKSFWLRAKKEGFSGKPPFGKAEEAMAVICAIVEELAYARDKDEQVVAVTELPYCVQAESSAFRGLLFDRYKQQTGLLPSSELTRAAQTYATRLGKDAPVHVVPPRFARKGNTCYVNMGKEYYEIDKDGSRPSKATGLLFVEGCTPLPTPKDGDLSSFDCINLCEDDLIRVLAFMVSIMHAPERGTPHLLISGGANTAKTSVARAIARTIDPHTAPIVGAPKSEESVIVTARARQVIVYDNLTRIPQWLSDALCTLATGGGISERKKYTDADLFATSVRRSVILTGIQPTMHAQDLVSRIVEVSPPAMQRVITDEQYEAALDAGHASRLAIIFDMLSRVLLEATELDDTTYRFPRYLAVGEVIAQRFFNRDAGWFAQSVTEDVEDTMSSVSEDDVVGQFAIAYAHELLAGGAGGIDEKPGVTFKAFERWLQGQDYHGPRPRDAKTLAQALVMVGGSMWKSHGVRICRDKKRRTLVWERQEVVREIDVRAGDAPC